MASSYCHSCGRPLAAGARFCEACGQPVSQQTGGYAGILQTDGYANVPQSKPRRRINGASIIAIIVGIMLILFGLRIPMLGLIGSTAQGVVTNVRQRVDSSSSKMEYNYEISYDFYTDSDKKISGNYHLNRVYNVSRLPAEGRSIRIRYLPGLPFFNLPDEQTDNWLSALLFLAFGVLLIFLGATGRVHLRRR